MKRIIFLTIICVCIIRSPAPALELSSLADCSIKVFREINRTHVWSGKAPAGCTAAIYVEKRPAGVFVTTWYSGRSESGWVRVSLSTAMGFFEVADRKTLNNAAHDVTSRTTRLERCLDSMIRVKDSLECRNYGTKSYLVGNTTGFEDTTILWLDDNGRHSVAEYTFGDTSEEVSAPADLFNGLALPPGTNLNIHVIDNN